MFREMRRKNQMLTTQDSIAILNRNTSGVLAISGDEGYPYSVPLSHVYQDGKLYFHCAKKGHKIDAIVNSNKASFCVIDADDVIPAEYTTYFRSVIAFGKIRVAKNDAEKREALLRLVDKYSPAHRDGGKYEIEKLLAGVQVLVFEIEHMTGKESIELVRAKK